MPHTSVAHPRTRRVALAIALAGATAALMALAVPAPARAAEAFVGVDTAGQLVTFSSDRVRPRRRALTGVPSGETILGLDVRPANRQLYALSSVSRLYTIDVGTATATAVGTAPFAPPLDGGSFGFDFNPTVDRIRVVSLTRQNLRLNQNDGTATLDGRLAYAPTDAAAAATPIVVGSAYTNPVAGATAT